MVEEQVKKHYSFLCVHCTASFTTPQDLEEYVVGAHPFLTICKDKPTNQLLGKMQDKRSV